MPRKEKPHPLAVERVTSVEKYAKRKGMIPSDYVREEDVCILSELLGKGILEKRLRDFYKTVLRDNINYDLKDIIRYLPRDNCIAFEEAGYFFENEGIVQDYKRHNHRIKEELSEVWLGRNYFLKGLEEPKPKVKKTLKAIACAGLIACVLGGTAYSAVDCDPNLVLDKNHNGAVSLPELLQGFDFHGVEALGNYIGHTFFFTDIDHDHDKLTDFDENYAYGSNPYDKDTDKDNTDDKKEVEIGTNLNNPDTDGDGLSDGEEHYKLGTDPLKWDTKGNGLGDYYESTHHKGKK